MAGGRPSKATDELKAYLCEEQSKGQPLAKLCQLEGIPDYSTVWRWEQEDEEFRKASARAREIGTHFLAGDCIRIADDPDLDPQHKRIMVDTRIRLIGKWNAKAYGDRIEHEHSGQIGIREWLTAAD